MRKVITARRGGAYEPELADILLADSQALMAGLDDELSRETILSHEPQPHGMLDEAGCDEAYLAMADMIDMRMPQTMGHSRRVAKLATDSATKMGLPASDVRNVRWAACVHDIGELAVPVATWLKPTPFTLRETDEMHLHPYHGERALVALGSNGPGVSNLVLRHHERLDGSGYHRHVSGNDLSPAARVLATAEAFQTSREERPHRPALNDAAAATRLREMVREGKLCPDASAAVLACAGQSSRRDKTERLAGLSTREIEVLRLIVAGNTAKQAALLLDIAPKTAENHIQNLYSKIGVTTRAGAALYAVERGLAG
jgi:HD-GYP domain-containing protein (c-di-GMP phosphodiesterase class II)